MVPKKKKSRDGLLVIVFRSPLGEPKVKLYKDADGQLKGDGLCCYLKVC